MKSVLEFNRVLIHKDPVDMRKGIDGLCGVIGNQMVTELKSATLFVFAGKRKDRIKVLYFDRTGFALWQKRLESHRFPWPKTMNEEFVNLTSEQFLWLLDGIDVWKLKRFSFAEFKKIA